MNQRGSIFIYTIRSGRKWSDDAAESRFRSCNIQSLIIGIVMVYMLIVINFQQDRVGVENDILRFNGNGGKLGIGKV